MENFINDDLDLRSSDNETDNESDNESNNESDNDENSVFLNYIDLTMCMASYITRFLPLSV